VDELVVRNLVARLGEKTFGWLHVADMQDSRSAEIPVALLNGCCEGPTLYIQAAVDGDELNPIAVARDVIAKIDPKKLSGKIIIVILTNFFGFHSKQQWNPIDNISMNRVWPGRADGYSSERIVHQLWNEAVIQANYAIDIHQTGTNPSVGSVYVRVAKNEPFHDETLEMAKIFGMGYILDEKLSKIYASDLLSVKAAETKLSWNATVKGIPTITPELSGTRGWHKPTILKGTKGVFNVLKWLKMISGEPELPEKQYVSNLTKNMICNRGGFLEWNFELGDFIKKGDAVVDVTDPFGRVLETLNAPSDGILWLKTEYPMISSGMNAGRLGCDYTVTTKGIS